MAQAVEEALEEKRHLIVEAGTGTGKTLAYLLPVIRSGKRVIISTGTKNLQEQLFSRTSLPALEHALFPRSRAGPQASVVCYMKGRNNYLCRKKLFDLPNSPSLADWKRLSTTAPSLPGKKPPRPVTGPNSPNCPKPAPSGISSMPELIPASARNARNSTAVSSPRCAVSAAESDIVIVNHHLFFADLSIKLEAEGAPDAGVLPECGAVIFDEAHELEDIAGNYFGISVSNLRVDELTRDLEQLLQREKIYTPQISGAIQALRERSQLFFSLLPPNEGRFAFDSRREFLEENGEEFIALNQALTRIAAELEQLPQKPEEVFSLCRRAQQLQVQLRFVMENEDPNTVFWIERRSFRGASGRAHAKPPAQQRKSGRSNVFLQATPIEVGQILRECLWSKLETSVLTSATLAVGGGFDYIRQRLGLDHARELIVPSHFDYESQAILYVPPILPDPRTPQFSAEGCGRHRQTLGYHTRTRFRTFHQLRANERNL